jgi:hypothetical protein
MIQGIMPTILRLDGLRVVVYPNDHRPAHVHVIGNGCEAVFYLKGPTAHPNCGRITISAKEIGRIKLRLAENLRLKPETLV